MCLRDIKFYIGSFEVVQKKYRFTIMSASEHTHRKAAVDEENEIEYTDIRNLTINIVTNSGESRGVQLSEDVSIGDLDIYNIVDRFNRI